MKTPDLKPCPFCGGEAKIDVYGRGLKVLDYHAKFSVCCKRCGVYTPSFDGIYAIDDSGGLVFKKDGRAEAVKRWNRRVNDENA